MNRNFKSSRNRGTKGRFSKRPRSGGGRGRRGGGGGRGRFSKNKINHEKFINKNPETKTIESYTPVNTFLTFNFHSHITDNLKKIGYETPTRIQDEAIPHIINGRDVIGLANTGSGKTAAFILPIIQKLKTQKTKENVLIVAPTRELAKQVEDEFKRFTSGMQLYSTICVGGLNINGQIRQLKRGPHVVIGTPGRLKDLINRKVLNLGNTTTLVLDEFDQMLDMGFLPDITFITDKLPQQKQSLCFSATITPDIKKILERVLKDPVTISVRTSETGEHIAQDIIKAGSKENKMDELVKMLKKDHFEKVLVFGAMKHSVQKLSNTLNKMGFKTSAIHGNKTQHQRQRALDDFKMGKVNILIATDVAARGLDIPNVSHVINFDQPNTHEEYVHRIGRTGRAGKQGQAYTFV